jgi:hypothetical protein
MPEILGSKAAQTTTDNFASELLIKVPSWISRVVYWVKELNVNAIEYTILGSMDGTNYETVEAANDVAKNGSEFTAALTDPWIYLDFQIKANVGAAQGSVKVYCTGN